MRTRAVTGVLRRGTGFALATAAALLYLRPAAETGISPTDFGRYLLPMEAAFDGRGAAAALWGTVRAGMTHADLGPAAVAPLAVWFTYPSIPLVLWLHAFVCALTCGAFHVAVVRLSGSRLVGAAAVVTTLCSIQFRVVADPFREDLLVLPLGVAFAFTALALAAGPVIRVRSLIAAACSFLIAVALVPGDAVVGLAIGIAIMRTGTARAALVAGWAFVAASFVGAFAVIYATGESPTSVLGGFLRTVVAPVPLLYRAGGNVLQDKLSGNARDMSFDLLAHVGVLDWIVVLAGAALIFRAVVASRPPGGTRGLVALVGGALWLGACFVPDDGAYLASFGFGLAIAGALAFVAVGERSHITAVTASLAVLLILYGNVRTNLLVQERTAVPLAAFQTLRHAADNGVFSQIPPNAAISLSATSTLARILPPDRIGAVLFDLTGRRFATARRSGDWMIRDSMQPGVSRTIDVVELTGSAPNWQTVRERTFAEFTSPVAARSEMDRFAGANHDGVRVAVRRFSDRFSLTDVYRTCGAASLDDPLASTGPYAVWGSGFYPFENPLPIAFPKVSELLTKYRAEDPPLRYARALAHLTIRDDGCGGDRAEPVAVKLHMYAQFPGTVEVTHEGAPPSLLPLDADGTQVAFTVMLSPHRSSDVVIRTIADRVLLDPLMLRADNVPIDDAVSMVELDAVRVAHEEKPQ